MIWVWIVRIIILAVGFSLHWAFGAFLVITLCFHMNGKANDYNQRYNLGGRIPGADGRPIRAPWYLF